MANTKEELRGLAIAIPPLAKLLWALFHFYAEPARVHHVAIATATTVPP